MTAVERLLAGTSFESLDEAVRAGHVDFAEAMAAIRTPGGRAPRDTAPSVLGVRATLRVRILRALEHGDVPRRELSTRLGGDDGSLARALRGLHDAGLIERTQTGGRPIVRLTDEGRDVLARRRGA